MPQRTRVKRVRGGVRESGVNFFSRHIKKKTLETKHQFAREVVEGGREGGARVEPTPHRNLHGFHGYMC